MTPAAIMMAVLLVAPFLVNAAYSVRLVLR